MPNKYKTGDKSPKESNWRQIEMGFIAWHQIGDIFAPTIKGKYYGQV